MRLLVERLEDRMLLSGPWTTEAPMPTARRSEAAAASNGILYVVGGDLGGPGFSATNDAYDPLSNTWTAKAPMPTGLADPALGVVNGTLYLFGGNHGYPGPTTTSEAYDPTTDTWTALAPMPTARSDVAAGVINGIIYVVGGSNGYASLSTVEAYDPATNTWSTEAPMPTPRAGLEVGVVNGVLYAVGGQGGPANSVLATVEAYDPATNTWSTKASMSTPRLFPAVGVINSVLYAAGGFDGGCCFLASMEAYDPTTNTWTTAPSMPTPRFDMASAVVNGVFYVVGGANATHSYPGLTTNEAFTPVPLDHLVITNQPPNAVVAGTKFDVQISAEDANGNVDTSFADSVTIALANNPGGSTLGGTLTVNAVNGVADFPDLTLDKPGTGYTFQATSNGLGPVTTASFDVKLPTTVGVFSSVDPSVWGQPVSLTVVVNTGIAFPVPTGAVAFFDETANTLLGFTSPTATLTTAALSVGSHVIQVTYSGDSNFAASSASLKQIVNQAATVTALGSSSNPSVFGQLLTFTPHVSADAPGAGLPSGAVTFLDGSTTLGTASLDASGTAALSGVSTLTIGTHTITATYSGDGNFTTSSATVSETVNPVTSANLSGVLSSTTGVSILVNNNTDAQTVLGAMNGLSAPTTQTNLTLNLGPGNYSDFVAGPPSGLNFFVIGHLALLAGVSPALTVTSGSVAVNGVTLTTATDAPTVLVTGGSLALRNNTIQESTGFTDSAIAITGGTLDLGTPSDPGGNILNVNGTGEFVHNTTPNLVTAVGDAFEVNGTALTATSLSFTGLSSSVNVSILNQPVTFTATVRPDGSGSPAGSVDFMDTTTNTDLGSAPVVGGTATLSTSALGVGSHVILATYSGDTTFTLSIDSLIQVVHYNFSGFLPPLSKNLAFALNRTIPIKFQLTDANGASITSLGAVSSLQIQALDANGNPTGSPFNPTAAGNTALRNDGTQYIFNWQTRGLTAGSYAILLTLNDGTVKTKVVNLNAAGAAVSGAGSYLFGPVSSGLPSASVTGFPQQADSFATRQAALNAVLADWLTGTDLTGKLGGDVDNGHWALNRLGAASLNDPDDFWSTIAAGMVTDKIIDLSGDFGR